MATGGYDRSADSRVTCSICLEPYRGRQPKLLPCSHTFCLPCLTQIAHKEKRRLTQLNEAESDVTITCPTCRTPIPLPPTGVCGLNSNVYVDDDGGCQSYPRPLLCDLCEEGHQAKLTCATCSTNFDTRCRRAHDRFCKSGQVSEVTLGSSQMAEVRVESGEEENKGDDATGSNTELQMMEAWFKKMKEKEKKKMEKQKTGSKQVLTTSASSLSGASLAVNTEQNANAENLASVVSQLMNKVTTVENQNALLFRDLTSLHDKHDREMTSLKAAGKKDRDAVASLQKEVGSLRDKNAILCQDNQELGNNLTKLQNDVTKDRNDVRTQSAMQAELTKFQSTQSTIQAELTKFQSTQSTMQAELTKFQSTQSTMQVELTKFQSTQSSMKAQLTKSTMQAELTKFQSTQSSMQAELTKYQSTQSTMQVELTKSTTQAELTKYQSTQSTMQSELAKYQSTQSTKQSELAKYQSTQSTMQAELAKYQSTQSTMQAELAKYQSTQSTMQAELAKYQSVAQANLTTVKTDQGELQTEQHRQKADIAKLMTGNDKLQMDLGKLQTEQQSQNSVTADFRSGTDKLQKDLGKLESDFRGLQSKQDKLKGVMNKQVAFEAVRKHWNNFTLNDEESVICDEVVSSVGGGYDPTTGVFTVPVSGVYGFMFSSTPDSDDNEDACGVDIMLDDKEIAYMCAIGKAMSTAHAFVHAMSGQKVRIRSYDNSKFKGGWFVTFSGVLIQPDL